MSVTWKPLLLFCMLPIAAPSWAADGPVPSPTPTTQTPSSKNAYESRSFPTLPTTLPVISPSLLKKILAPGAHGGADGGGGGKGVLCDGRLRTLDLYEAEEIYHLPISRTLPNLESAFKTFYPRLSEYYGGTDDIMDPWGPHTPNDPDLTELNWHIVEKIHDIEKGDRLPLTSDATVPSLPSNCQIVQIIVVDYPTTKEEWSAWNISIRRDPIYWSLLSAEDQAALILHEFLYDLQGLGSGVKSDDVRRIIGLIFAGQKLSPLNGAVKYAQNHWTSHMEGGDGRTDPGRPVFDEDTMVGRGDFGLRASKGYPRVEVEQDAFHFHVIPEVRNGQSGVGFYFDQFKGVNQVIELSAFAPGYTTDQFNNAREPFTIRMQAVQLFTGKVFNVEMKFGHWKEMALSQPYDSYDCAMRAWNENEKAPEFSYGGCGE